MSPPWTVRVTRIVVSGTAREDDEGCGITPRSTILTAQSSARSSVRQCTPILSLYIPGYLSHNKNDG
jgi:hypothetical protein